MPPANLMQQALHLAMLSRGMVEPNPMVGCIIAKDARIIGQGRHEQFGGPHAEPNALAACHEDPAGATVYVTLEPCCHTDKKTPPCVPALIRAKIARVVAACADPNPPVSGNGFEQLRRAGISVEVGLLEAPAKQLNAPFFARILHRRPYVTLKWAQTADAKVAGPAGQRMQISSPASMQLVHRLRARSDAILVGISTALADNPLLTARDVSTARPLLRVVLDAHLRLPPTSQLAQTSRQSPVLVYCAERTQSEHPARLAALESAGVTVVPVPLSQPDRLDLNFILADLANRRVTHLLVEGGPTILQSFLAQNLADRIWRFRSSLRIDSPTAPAAPAALPVDYPSAAQITLAGDTLEELLNPASPVFFDLAPSPDIVLETEAEPYQAARSENKSLRPF